MIDNRIELLRKWVLDANPELTELGEDTDIIDERVITSMQFVSFILYIEELRGSALDVDEIDVDSLRTLSDIERNYLSRDPSESRSA